MISHFFTRPFLEKQIQKVAEQGNAGGKFCVYKE